MSPEDCCLGFDLVDPPPLVNTAMVGERGNNSTEICIFRFGASITGIGDLDGGGVADIVVGAFQDDKGGPDRGAIHIMFVGKTAVSREYSRI